MRPHKAHLLRKKRGQSVSDGMSRASLRVFAVKIHWQCCGAAALFLAKHSPGSAFAVRRLWVWPCHRGVQGRREPLQKSAKAASRGTKCHGVRDARPLQDLPVATLLDSTSSSPIAELAEISEAPSWQDCGEAAPFF